MTHSYSLAVANQLTGRYMDKQAYNVRIFMSHMNTDQNQNKANLPTEKHSGRELTTSVEQTWVSLILQTSKWIPNGVN